MQLSSSQEIQIPSDLSRYSLLLMAHEYSNMLFTTANHWSLSLVKKWQSKISS